MTTSKDPFAISADGFAEISDKTSTWTAKDWQQMALLLRYRRHAIGATKRFLDDLTTEQLTDVYESVRDKHVLAHPNAQNEWHDRHDTEHDVDDNLSPRERALYHKKMRH